MATEDIELHEVRLDMTERTLVRSSLEPRQYGWNYKGKSPVSFPDPPRTRPVWRNSRKRERERRVWKMRIVPKILLVQVFKFINFLYVRPVPFPCFPLVMVFRLASQPLL